MPGGSAPGAIQFCLLHSYFQSLEIEDFISVTRCAVKLFLPPDGAVNLFLPPDVALMRS